MNKFKLIYAILKELEKGNLKFTCENFGIEEEEFNEAIRFADREGFIEGVFYADNIPYSLVATELTMRGYQYLKENSVWSKTYKGIKEVRDWLKL